VILDGLARGGADPDLDRDFVVLLYELRELAVDPRRATGRPLPRTGSSP
jgi:hypothetical protein